MKYMFDVGEMVRIDDDAPAFGAPDHSGEIGFITDRHPYPKGFEAPYDVDFGNGEIQSYYDYELERSG